ncbi:hypothetical protein ABK040_011038 [Willaertia magna]
MVNKRRKVEKNNTVTCSPPKEKNSLAETSLKDEAAISNHSLEASLEDEAFIILPSTTDKILNHAKNIHLYFKNTLIPEDIIHNILMFVSQKDFLNLLQLNSDWHLKLLNTPSILNTIFERVIIEDKLQLLKQVDALNFKKYLSADLNKFPNLKKLGLIEIDNLYCNLNKLQLTSLRLNKCSFKSVEIKDLTNLTHLTINNCSNIKVGSFINTFTKLQILETNYLYCSIKSLLNLTQLTVLKIPHYNNKNEAIDLKLLEQLTQLTVLDLSYNKIDNIANLQNFNKLQKLKLILIRSDNEKELILPPSLNTLNSTYNSKLVEFNSYQLTNLTNLSMMGCTSFDSSNLNNLTSLLYLDIRRVGATDNDLANCINLVELNIEGCTAIFGNCLLKMKKLINLRTNNNISDSNLVNLFGIRELSIFSKHFVTKQYLLNFHQVWKLILSTRDLVDHEILKSLPSLRHLKIQGLKDYFKDSLKDLDRIEILEIFNCNYKAYTLYSLVNLVKFHYTPQFNVYSRTKGILPNEYTVYRGNALAQLLLKSKLYCPNC